MSVTYHLVGASFFFVLTLSLLITHAPIDPTTDTTATDAIINFSETTKGAARA